MRFSKLSNLGADDEGTPDSRPKAFTHFEPQSTEVRLDKTPGNNKLNKPPIVPKSKLTIGNNTLKPPSDSMQGGAKGTSGLNFSPMKTSNKFTPPKSLKGIKRFKVNPKVKQMKNLHGRRKSMQPPEEQKTGSLNEDSSTPMIHAKRLSLISEESNEAEENQDKPQIVINMPPSEEQTEETKSEKGVSPGSDAQIPETDKTIEDYNDFLAFAGLKIESENQEKLTIQNKLTGAFLKVSKNVFAEYMKGKSPANKYNIQVSTGINNSSLSGTKSMKNLSRSNSMKLNSNTKGREQAEPMNDEMSSVDQASEVQGLNVVSPVQPPEEEKKGGFADIFGGLEGMSNTSTLFDGIDDDDDAPPPLNTRQVASVDQEIKHAEDQSQQDPNHTQSQVSEIDPFDMRNFKRSSFAMNTSENDDFITQTKTMKLMDPKKFYDPSIEINKLREELRVKNDEIQRMTMKMMNMRQKDANESMIFNEDIHAGSSSYHLAFLFASPLVRRINSNIEMIMQLDYKNEILGIERQLKGVKHEIRYKVDVATQSNFRSVIVDAPFALHFTGHGIKNDQKALGSAYMQFKDKGDILLLEDENGMADYLFENDLKKLVEISKANREFSHNYEVVFVSSCFSEFTGKIFLSSGARHVICIQQNERISDKASLRFSKVFYETLFVKKYSVCNAFKIAKEDIRSLINNGEANKFLLLVNERGEGGSKVNHKCFPIAKFKKGTLTKHEKLPMYDSIPSSVDNFRGRQQEMCEIISLLHQNRLVNILGPPGIGKTSIARNLCNHLKDRNKFEDGMIYVGLRGCESAQMFLTRLSLAIQANAEHDQDDLTTLQKFTSTRSSPDKEGNLMNNEDEEIVKTYMVKVLRNCEVLIILDNCEDPLEDDCDKFVQQLDYLLNECPRLKMLLTSRKYINKLEHNHEAPYHLYSLSPQAALKLLLEKAPRDIKNEEIQELLNYKIPDNHPIHQHFPTLGIGDVALSNHPFTLMLGGHPQAICLAAPMLETQSLCELFEQLLGSNIMDALGYGENQSYASLRLSLEVSISNIKKTQPEALDLFMLIGLLPGGIKQPELNELYGDTTWKSYKDTLIRASLLLYKPAENILTLLTFMSTRAFELLEEDEDKKTSFHLKCCKFYKQFCITFLDKMNINDFNMSEFVEREPNIWACIYRGINRKKDNNEFDEEEEDEEEATPLMAMRSMNDNALLSFKDQLINQPRSANLQLITEEQDSSGFEEDNDFEREIDDLEDECEPRPQSIKKATSSAAKSRQQTSKLGVPKLSMEKKQMSVFNERKKTQPNFNRLNTEQSEIRSGTLTKSLTKSITTALKPNASREEEYLVLYYISIVIRLCKLSDGLKALSEYKKKEGMSTRAQAHLAKFQGVLTLLSEKKEYTEAYEHFNKAFDLFHHIRSSKGKALCRLAMIRCQLDMELNKNSEQRDIKGHLAKVEKAKSLFESIGHKLGAERADQYIQFLNKRVNGQKDTGIQKLMKFKTFKRNHVESVKADDSLVEQNILNDVDIRLFVEVIKDEDDKKDEVRRRIISTSLSRSNFRTSSIDSSNTTIRSSHTNLSSTGSNLKFKKKRMKFLHKIKGFATRTNTNSRFKGKMKSIEVLNLRPKASFSRYSSTSMASNK